MARRKISAKFRQSFSEKIMELGNLVATALVFGQFISSREFSLEAFILGMIFTGATYFISYEISR